MIVGFGSDLVDIRRIQRSMDRFGARFIDRVFAPSEQRRCDPRGDRVAAYARRFAAKEACAKALGSGIFDGVFWRDMVIENDDEGRPTLRLSGGAAERLVKLTPPGRHSVVHVTLTDEPPYAQAMVLIEARTGGSDKAEA